MFQVLQWPHLALSSTFLFKVSHILLYNIQQQHVATLHLPLPPVPTPSITASNTDTIVYAGTTLSLTCDYTLSPSVDTTPQTAVTWMVDGVAVDTSPGRISTDGATLRFSPLATSDTDYYTCTLTVTATQTHGSIQGEMQSVTERILVRGI